jgi:hypothetical protein
MACGGGFATAATAPARSPSVPWPTYATHVRRDITPHIGRILLRELSLDDLQLLFAILARTPTRYGRARAPSSLHRIRPPSGWRSTPPSAAA